MLDYSDVNGADDNEDDNDDDDDDNVDYGDDGDDDDVSDDQYMATFRCNFLPHPAGIHPDPASVWHTAVSGLPAQCEYVRTQQTRIRGPTKNTFAPSATAQSLQPTSS